MQMDELLYGIAELVKRFAVIYLVDIDQVPDFNKMYELYDPISGNVLLPQPTHQVDMGTGNNNKINWAMRDKQELLDIVEVVYKGAKKGKGLVVSPRDYSSKYRH